MPIVARFVGSHATMRVAEYNASSKKKKEKKRPGHNACYKKQNMQWLFDQVISRGLRISWPHNHVLAHILYFSFWTLQTVTAQN